MSQGKATAIVTGGSRGIGRAIAVALGSRGFNVVVNFNSNASAADECAAMIRSAGGAATTVQADVARLEDHQRILDTAIETFGGVDVLVNNAGIAPKVRADLMEMTPESYDALLNTNLRGPFFLTQRVAAHMLKKTSTLNKTSALKEASDNAQARSIINISSISAFTVSTNRGEYCIAKAGVAMMTQLFAARLAAQGINVFEIRPGIIATDMTSSDAVRAKYDKLIHHDDLLPNPRWGEPGDIAKAVLAIADGAFAYSPGQVFNIDGGFHIRRL